MERIASTPRPDWQAAVEARGLKWHTGQTPYWSEDAYYQFTTAQIETLERATNELHERCLEAVQHVIDEERYAELKIPEHAIPLITASWKEEPPSVYGRFDLAYDGTSPPKMLEYNADTPTSLLEVSVIQWDWLQSLHPGADQFNSVHEKLVDYWKSVQDDLPSSGPLGPLVHFASVDDLEDGMTAAYLAETAAQAGLQVKLLAMADIGWDPQSRELCDLQDTRLDTLFKLYPWEWLMHEPFGDHLRVADRARVEDGPVQQGHPPHSVGNVSRPRQPSAILLRRAARHVRVRKEAAPLPRRRERHRAYDEGARRINGRIWRRGLRVPGAGAHSRV